MKSDRAIKKNKFRFNILAQRRNETGSITIFLSLIIFCLLELFLLLLELGRIEVMEYRANEISRISLDSSFAGYVRSAFDRYGILMYWGEKENLEKDINQYIVNNVSGIGEVKHQDFFQMESTGALVQQYTCITQENGEKLGEQVETVMKYKLGSEAAKKLLEQCTGFQSGKETQELFEKVEEQGDTVIAAQEELEKIYDGVKKISSLKSNPKVITEELLNALLEGEEQENIPSKLEKRIAKLYVNLQKSWKEHNEACEKLQKAIADYHAKIDDLKQSVSQLESDIRKNIFPDYSQFQKEMQSCVSTLSNSTDGEGQKEINDVEEKAKEYKKNLDSCKQFLNSFAKKDFLDDYNGYCQGVTVIYEELSDYEQTLPTIQEKQSGEELEGYQKILKKIKKGGLALVVGDTSGISAKMVDKSALPSVTENYKKGSRAINLKKIVFGEYCLEHFGSYTNKKGDSALDYELEYLLGGKASDLDNLDFVVKTLLPLRAGFNVLHILKSPKKMGEAEALAASLCGWTGIPGITILAKYILIQIWSYGEAVIDVKDLLDGKKVPLIKNEGQWTLALSGLKGISSKMQSDNTGEKGFDYQNYIRFLLAVQQQGVQYYRCMDLIQMNLNAEEDTFRMKNCIVSADITVTFHTKALFLDFTNFSKGMQQYVIQAEKSMNYE